MKPEPCRILYLSINADGVMSLWDNPEQRGRGADARDGGEGFVDLPLTQPQTWMLLKAQPEKCEGCRTKAKELEVLRKLYADEKRANYYLARLRG